MSFIKLKDGKSYVNVNKIVGVTMKSTKNSLYYNEIYLSCGQTIIPGYYYEEDCRKELDFIVKEIDKASQNKKKL